MKSSIFLHIYTQIENLTQLGNVSISVIINELLECRLEAVVKELPPEMARKITMIREDQIKRPLVGEKIKAGKKSKSPSSK